MIHETLKFLQDELARYVVSKLGDTTYPPVTIGNVVRVMMLTARRSAQQDCPLPRQLEEDRVAKQQEPFVRTDTGVTYNSPLLYLNKSNPDDAFLRRFTRWCTSRCQAPAERRMLWEKSLPGGLWYNGRLNLREIADAHELSGASILNAVQYGALPAYARGDGALRQTDLLEGVWKELLKEEKAG